MAILEDKLLEETLNRKAKQFFRECLAPIQNDIETLERLFNEASKDAEIADDYTRIMTLINKLEEVYKTENILQFKNRLNDVIKAVKSFLRHKKDIPSDLLSKIAQVVQRIETLHTQKYNDYSTSLERLKDAATKLSNILDISKSSSKTQMRIWAEAFEILANDFDIIFDRFGSEEDREFPAGLVENLKNLCLMILSKTSDIYAPGTKREEYKYRIRCAARSTIYTVDQQKAKAAHQESDLWENPPEATQFLKEALATVKDSFKVGDQWNGTFCH